MSLNSESIQKKEFHIVFKGYKPEEVDKFLDMLSAEFNVLQKRIKELEEALDSLKYEGDKESSKMKTVIQEALISAHRVAEEIKQKARVEAEELVSKKRMEEEQELNNLKNEKESIKANISGLKIEYNDFKDQISKFADDLKQKTLNFNDTPSLEDRKKIDFSNNIDDIRTSENAPARKEEESVKNSKGNIDAGTEEESNMHKAKGAGKGDIEEKEGIYKHVKKEKKDSSKEIATNELEDLASITDEMFEELNRKGKTGTDDKKTGIKEPDESNHGDDKRKTNRKKIDIANQDVINDFFSPDED